MTEDFTDKVALLASKDNFVSAIKQSLNEIIGESATSIIIHHLGGAEVLQDPKVFEERLKAIFGAGAEIILKRILKNLETLSEDSGAALKNIN